MDKEILNTIKESIDLLRQHSDNDEVKKIIQNIEKIVGENKIKKDEEKS